MRLAVFSDIHGNLPALESALDDLESVGGADQIWHLGDYCAFGLHGSQVIERLREQAETLGKEHVKFIGGNTDRYLITGERFKTRPIEDQAVFAQASQTRQAIDSVLNWNLAQLTWDDYQWLAGLLGKELSLTVRDYGTAIGFHAIPGDDETFLDANTPDEQASDYLLDREGRLAIYGHIHQQLNRDLGKWQLVNVGSVGDSKTAGVAHWGLFTFEDNKVDIDLRQVSFDTEPLVTMIEQSDFPLKNWLLTRLGLA
jgi:predicted phosphodiesterase